MLIFLLAVLLVHPVHETVAEVEWNADSGRMEVALRLDVLDEQWLQKASAADTDHAKWAIKYLATRFQLSDRPQFMDESATNEIPKRSQYHWIGHKSDGAHVWWYFEVEPREPKRPTWIRQRMFFDRDQRYTNRVIVLDQEPRQAFTLTAEKPIANLDNQNDESLVAGEPEQPKS